jgi:hypothetical protein
MCDQLKSLSTDQLEHLIKKSIDNYHDEHYSYEVKDLDTPNAGSKLNKLSFKVEIRCGK